MATRNDFRADLGPARSHPDDRLVVEVSPPAAAVGTVTVRGEVDVATAPTLRRRLDALLAEGVHDLDLDLTDVPFIDVAGLNVLLLVQSRLVLRGGRLTVLRPCRSLKIMDVALGAELLPHR